MSFALDSARNDTTALIKPEIYYLISDVFPMYTSDLIDLDNCIFCEKQHNPRRIEPLHAQLTASGICRTGEYYLLPKLACDCSFSWQLITGKPRRFRLTDVKRGVRRRFNEWTAHRAWHQIRCLL